MLQEINSSYWQANEEFPLQSKRLKLTQYNHALQQQGGRNPNLVATEASPLGLSLKKSPSFTELIQAALNPKPKPKPKPKRGRPKKDDSENLKAKSLNAELISIGSWERCSVKDQDVVAKCYYQKRKLVWEILDGRLKSKIEIQWSDITAIRAAFPQNMNAVLEIEVKSVPLFFRERPPQPRKQSHWELAADFTGGQACRYRRHRLEFREGSLQPLYEKLLQCDRQLLALSQQPFTVNAYPYFGQNISANKDCSLVVSKPPSDSSQNSPYGATYAPSHEAHLYEQPNRRLNYSELLHTPINWENNTYMGKVHHFEQSPYQVMPLSTQPLPPSGKGMTRAPSTNSLLKEISTQLLDGSVASVCTDEEKLMARVESMCNLLDLHHEQSASNDTNTSNVHSTNNSAESRTSDESNVSEESSKARDSYNWMSAIGLDKEIWKGHERIPSFSNLFFDEEDAPRSR